MYIFVKIKFTGLDPLGLIYLLEATPINKLPIAKPQEIIPEIAAYILSSDFY
jgi:hypothetical protein